MALDKKFSNRIAKLAGIVTSRTDSSIHDHVIRTGSPSVDFTYGNAWGLPRGYGNVLFGPPKAGKSLFSFSATGQVHKDYPSGHVFKFDTEFRDTGQLSAAQAKRWGIDLDRYHVIQTNRAGEVFDTIESEIGAMCSEGMDVPLIIIDSINGIMGRRMANADSIEKMQIGDQALTLQEGFKRILAVQRRYGIGIIVTAQVRAEMDQHEIMRGHTTKMAASFGVQHWGEYFTYIERIKSKAGKEDFLKRAFTNEEKQDLAGNAENTAHRIKVTMRGNSFGVDGRTGIMTFDYQRGLINQSHEVFELAQKRNIIESNGAWYSFKDFKSQKNGFVEQLEKDPDLSRAILRSLMESDKGEGDLVGSAELGANERIAADNED